jgi:Domain of unknown function (DUF4157)
MIFQRQTRPPSSSPSYAPPIARRLLQRKCACGGTPGPDGECEACKRKRLSLQPKLTINQPGDQYEQEADRVAEAVVSGVAPMRGSISSLGTGSAVQREEPAKPKTEEEKYKESAKKVGEAFLETAPGKEIKKKAEELGDAFIATLPGKIITGTAVAGAVATLAATHKQLPIGIPEIPLDKIKPGLKMKITYEGPVDKPINVMATFSFTLGAGKAPEKKSAITESEKFRAETARMAAEQAKFREGLKTPEEKAAEKQMFDAYLRSKMLSPGQLTPSTQALSFGVAGEQLGFKPLIPAGAGGSALEPWSPDFKLTGEAPATESPTKEEPQKKEEESLQRKAAGCREISTAPPIVDEVLQSSGEALDPATRKFFEKRFGYDFGRVRVHTDVQANESARAVGAHAYAVGRHIAFEQGRYAPHTPAGVALLAHELVHVSQSQEEQPTLLQRRSDPIRSVLIFFGFQEGDFSKEELIQYLEQRRVARDIEGDSDSDNKARIVVRLWKGGDSKFTLDADLKAVLIKEMFTGFTGSSDQEGILDLLEPSENADLVTIFRSGLVDPTSLLDSFSGPHEQRLRDFYAQRFRGGLPTLAKGTVEPIGEPGVAGHLTDKSFREKWQLELRAGLDLLTQSTARKGTKQGCAFPGDRPREDWRFDPANWRPVDEGKGVGRYGIAYEPVTRPVHPAVDALFDHLELWDCDCAIFGELAWLYAWRHSVSEKAFDVKFADLRLRVQESSGLERESVHAGDEAKSDPALMQAAVERKKRESARIEGLESGEESARREVEEEERPGFNARWDAAPVGTKVVWRNLSASAVGTAWEYENAVKIAQTGGGRLALYRAHPFGTPGAADLLEEDSTGGAGGPTKGIRRLLAENNVDFPGRPFEITDTLLAALASEPDVTAAFLTDLATLKGRVFFRAVEFPTEWEHPSPQFLESLSKPLERLRELFTTDPDRYNAIVGRILRDAHRTPTDDEIKAYVDKTVERHEFHVPK